MSEASTETVTVSSNGDSGGRSSLGAEGRAAAPPRRETTVVQSRGAGPAIRTPLGTAPIIPLLMIGFGAYLLWFMSKYWRGSGPAVWPSYPIKSALQGKGVPPPQPAPPSSAQVAAVESSIATATGPSQQAPPTGAPGPGGGTPPGGVQAGPGEKGFFSAVLQNLRAPITAANLFSLYAWARKEEPGFPPQSVGGFAWNPLNIKGPSGAFQNYPDATAGAQGTASFMLVNNYPNIVAAFRSGRGLCGNPSVASDLSRWSGGGGVVPPPRGYSSVC